MSPGLGKGIIFECLDSGHWKRVFATCFSTPGNLISKHNAKYSKQVGCFAQRVGTKLESMDASIIRQHLVKNSL
jgi:hypothetical protein